MIAYSCSLLIALAFLSAVYAISPELRYGSLFVPANDHLHLLTPLTNSYHPLFHPLLTAHEVDPYLLTKSFSTASLLLVVSSLVQLIRGGILYRGILAGGITITLELLFGIDVLHLWVVGCILLFFSRQNFMTLSLAMIGLGVAHPALLLLLAPLFFPLLPRLSLAERYGTSSIFIILLLIGYSVIEPSLALMYASTGHLVPDDGIAGFISPLTNNTPPLPAINREALKDTLELLALSIGSLGLIYGLYEWRSDEKKGIIISAISVFFMLDILPSEEIALISPLQSLKRIIPGLFIFSLAPIMLALLIGVVPALLSKRARDLYIYGVLSVALLYQSQGLVLGKITSRHQDTLIAEAKELPLTNQKQILSPSFYLHTHYGLYKPLNTQSLKTLSMRRFKNARYYTLQGIDPRGIRRVHDGAKHTRFPVAKGGQKGNEFLCIEFLLPQPIAGFHLSTGNFTSDFPRGLEVSRSHKNCRQLISEHFHTKSTFSFPTWEGPIRYTKDGRAYFSHQTDVEIVFPDSEPSISYLFRQTKRSQFDWSIAEIEVWKE